MSAYESRPWLHLYRSDIPADLETPPETALDSFLAIARQHPERTFLDDGGTAITYGETASKATAFAAALLDSGIERGDRVAVYLQNRPEFAFAQLGIWSAGAVQVPLNPMMRSQELHHLLTDSGTRTLVTQDDLWELAGREGAVSAGVGSAFVVGDVAPGDGVQRWTEALTAFDGTAVPNPHLQPDEVAHLVYTSGTTGRPKGAMNTHGNVSFNAEVFTRWLPLDADDVILGGAPLFHVTGLVGHLAAAYRSGCSISLFGRFDTERCLETIERTRATFSVMSITAYIALLDAPSIRTRDLSSLTKVCSGGAPVPLATVERWREVTGRPICNIYGLTETTSPSHLPASLSELAPVDQVSGTLSVGVPVPSTYVRVVDPDSMRDVDVGEEGELWIKGPQVVPGYWERPDATRESIVDGYFRTGDVGRMDERGFFYVVDRIKDMINASGFKVWPREVEDYLYQHPAVREAAVVGVPDPYRGETVKAFISLKTDISVTAEEIIAFCRGRMAAYKYPRLVEIVDEVPKTTSGKILRRELRERATSHPDRADPASPGRPS